MMICKADFEELFPETFKPAQHPLEGKGLVTPTLPELSEGKRTGAVPDFNSLAMRCRVSDDT